MVKSSKLTAEDSEHISVNFNHFDDVVRIHTYSNPCQHVVVFFSKLQHCDAVLRVNLC